MQTSIFWTRLKKHRQYLYISMLLIAVFFIGSSLITPKITSVTEDLIQDIIQGNLKSKENIVAFEFNQLNSSFKNSQKILRNSQNNSFEFLKEKLLFTSDLSIENHSIYNSFVSIVSSNKLHETHFSNKEDSLYQKEIHTFLKDIHFVKDEVVIDTVVTRADKVINRKIYIKKLPNNKVVYTGYDVDLISFWSYFSETYKGDGGYTVVTNKDGICMLHPDTKYIGKKIESYFSTISIKKILNSSLKINGYFVPNNINSLKDKAISEFLGLEVLRYYDTIKIGNIPLIVVVSFPVGIHLKETTKNIQGYFSWISFLAFTTFMLLLIASRLQLKKEYVENLKVVEEKEQLTYSNEKYQKENAILQLNQLKKKINPHFLFNSLNSLHVLIDLNPDLSQQFVLKLADVYRYLLDEREGNLISVKEEMSFLEQYIFLQEIRFNKSLHVTIKNNCDDTILVKKIPFLSLETLVENAIKHNEITKINPLMISVVINEDFITIKNNYTPRKCKAKDSHHIGLTYLENTYQFYNISAFKTGVIDDEFVCILPFIT
ncbi:histidine kinase [Polaribacter sp. Z014]|uniref:sensor histidine kinase n=1 Tax=Polaribacter sp. Z014 TaxID=2927126 RepID=UPI002021ABD1|nr:histidine kinase [Polaribacter sp. Z014]MCL7764023.1 histidine kinase [Polaribacter sp. Z014]